MPRRRGRIQGHQSETLGHGNARRSTVGACRRRWVFVMPRHVGQLVAAGPTFRGMERIFSTEVEKIDGATLIHVRGEIDIVTAERLRDAIEPFLGPEQRIVLDFAEVHFMDSSCLNVLVPARGSLTADGGSLVLRNPSAMARRVLNATGLQDLLDEDARDNPTST